VKLYVWVLTVGLLQALTGAAPGDEPARPGKLSVAGQVVGPGGTPVAGARVYLRQWPTVQTWQKTVRADREILATTTTGQDGRFAFQEVSPSHPDAAPGMGMQAFPWDIVVKAGGYGLGFKPLTARNHHRPLTLTLGPEASIRGRLLDHHGKPVAGVKVQVSDLRPLAQKQQVVWGPAGYYVGTGDLINLKESQFQPAGVSDAEGRFVITGLPREQSVGLVLADDRFVRELIYAATTTAPQASVKTGVPGQYREYPVHTGDFTLTLQPGHSLNGEVVCADTGKPAAAARVTLSGEGQSFESATDARGRFRIAQLAPGKHLLQVHAPENSEYLATATAVDIPADRREVETQVKLARGVLVRGRVVDEETGRGVAGVTLGYEGQALAAGSFTSPVQTGDDGSFGLTVPPGKGKVRVSWAPPGYYLPTSSVGPATMEDSEGSRKELARHVQEVDARPDQPVRGLNFTIGRGRVVTGRVLDPEGKPVRGAQVAAPVLFGRTVLPVDTDGAGRFTLSGLAPDQEQDLGIIHPGRKLGAQLSLPAGGNRRPAPLEVRLQPLASASGRVLDEGKKPIAGAPVTLMVKRTSRGMTYYSSRDATEITSPVTSDREGKFIVDTLLPGADYMVQVTAEGHAGAQVPQFTAQAGHPRALGDLTLVKADQSVAGVVVDPTGKPLEGLQVYAYPQRAGVTLGRFEQVMTDKGGRFRIGNLPGGPIQVTASGPTVAVAGGTQVASSARVMVEAGKQDVRIVMLLRPATHAPAAAAGKPAPDFPVGRWLNAGSGPSKPSFSGTAFQGKVVLLAFLDEARPSQRLLPALDRLSARLADRGLVIVRVYERAPARGGAENGEDELARQSPTPAALVVPGLVPGGYSEAFQRYGVRATPTLFLLDRKGIVRDADLDPADLEARVKELLGG
jgi:protocatechuate 3,4-dioxygenase beta subunit